MGMNALTLMHAPPVPHVVFGIFNLAWPDIAFWAVGIVIFAIGAYARIPEFMEMDADEQNRYHAEGAKGDKA